MTLDEMEICKIGKGLTESEDSKFLRREVKNLKREEKRVTACLTVDSEDDKSTQTNLLEVCKKVTLKDRDLTKLSLLDIGSLIFTAHLNLVYILDSPIGLRMKHSISCNVDTVIKTVRKKKKVLLTVNTLQ